MRRRVKWLPLLLPLLLLALAHADRDPDSIGNWRNASRAPVGLAPDPAVTPEGVVQVYAARAVRWRGYFGVHTWIAAKPANAPAFTVYEVTGFRVRRGGSAVTISQRDPDGRWFGSAPHLLADVRGPGVDPLVQRIEHAVAAYPYNDTYRIWPGPNSNSFVTHVLCAIPEARISLPPTAIGKDYRPDADFIALTPSQTGLQLSLGGLFGLTVGWVEGVELNLLGLVVGVDLRRPAIKIPGFGRIGVGMVVA